MDEQKSVLYHSFYNKKNENKNQQCLYHTSFKNYQTG